MTIVLTGVTGVRNRGVEALVRSALDGIARHLPGEATAVLTTDPRYDAAVLDGAASVVADWPAYFGSGKLQRYLRQVRATVRARNNLLRPIEVLRSATAVVATGGDVFSSDYRTSHRHVGHLETAQTFGRPTVLLAHSIGPFRTKLEADQMRGVLKDATLITVRESRSRDYVVRELGIPAERVRLTADVAFLLTPSPPDRVLQLRRAFGLHDSDYVTVAPSEGITSFSATKDREAHDRAWVRTIERILSTSHDEVLIIPHVQDALPSNDDRRIASRLMEAMDYHPRVRVAWGELSASDFKGLIQHSRQLIGERMHACIAALSTAVPTIAIGYSVKAQGIMEDLLGESAAADGLHIPVEHFVASDGLADEIAGLARNRDRIQQRLGEASEAAKGLAQENFLAMREVLGRCAKTAA